MKIRTKNHLPLLNSKTLRRGRHKIKKIFLLIIPLLIILLTILAIYAILLLKTLHKPLYISPLSTLGIQTLNSQEDYQAQLLEKLLKDNKISYTKIIRMPYSSYLIKTEDNGEIIITFQNNIYQQISSLQFILSRLTMEGKQFEKLDLRYDKPVIILQK